MGGLKENKKLEEEREKMGEGRRRWSQLDVLQPHMILSLLICRWTRGDHAPLSLVCRVLDMALDVVHPL